MQCCDTGEIGRLRHVLGTPVGGLVAGVAPTHLRVPPRSTDVGLIDLLGPVGLPDRERYLESRSRDLGPKHPDTAASLGINLETMFAALLTLVLVQDYWF
jgi:hypothetical protein